jgi:cytochrome c556
MKKLILAATILAASLPAAAQFQKAEDAIKYRQSAMTLMGAHFGRLAGMAQGRIAFDAKAAADNATVLSALVFLPFGAYGAGTDKGAPTRVKPEIWSNAAGFKTRSDEMQAAVAKLDAAARSGNLDALKAAVGPVGDSCKGCHDDFRNEKYSN